MTITDIYEGLKQARRVALAFQDRFETNPVLCQRAARTYGSLSSMQTHVQKLLDPIGFDPVDDSTDPASAIGGK